MILSKNHTIHLFYALSANEQAEFVGFLTFSASDSALLQTAATYLQQRNIEDLATADFDQSIFQSKATTARRANLLFRLGEELQRFVLWLDTVRLAEAEKQLKLQQFFQHRGLDAWRKKSIRRFTEALKAERLDSAARFGLQFEYLELELERDQSTKKRSTDFDLDAMTATLGNGQLAAQLRHACAVASHQRLTNTPYKTGMLPLLLEYIETQHLFNQPTIGLYYQCYRFLTAENGEVHFRAFRQIIATIDQQLPARELRNLYLLAINFAISKVNEMNEVYFGETLNLYQWALDNDILLENGRLSPYTYNNSIALAIRMGELEWATQAVERFREKLPVHQRSEIVALNRARIAYAKQQPAEALVFLQQADYKDFIHLMSAKIMQLKIYYELNELEVLESHLDSLKSYLQRQKNGGYHLANYRNIVNYARKLVKLNFDDAKAVAHLRNQIAINKRVTERGWFLSVLDS